VQPQALLVPQVQRVPLELEEQVDNQLLQAPQEVQVQTVLQDLVAHPVLLTHQAQVVLQVLQDLQVAQVPQVLQVLLVYLL
jgi:hypothetical protein